jgi:outer membrane protein TolC
LIAFLLCLLFAGCEGPVPLPELRRENLPGDREALAQRPALDGTPLSLKDVIGFALANNADLGVLRGRIEAQRARIAQASLGGLPSLSAEMEASRRLDPSVSFSENFYTEIGRAHV